jgi:CBS domain-containing protein
MLLKDICTPDVICCAPGTTIADVARLMRDRHVGDVVVVDDPQDDRTPLGIVTDRDIVVGVLAQDLDPATTRVNSVMRKPVVIAGESEDTAEVLTRMRTNGVRRLPVVGDGGALVGIVTLDDLLGVVVEEATTLLQVVSRGQNRERHSRR